jgi:hypothetical protein
LPICSYINHDALTFLPGRYDAPCDPVCAMPVRIQGGSFCESGESGLRQPAVVHQPCKANRRKIMSGVIEGTLPVEISEIGKTKVGLQQKSADGTEQRIELEMHQAEELANWLRAWLEESREGLVNE